MAKNKNRDRNKQQTPPAEARGSEESRSSEDRSDQVQSRITPSDMPHKGKQKRFGHN
ncbi:hypothetical protein [Streptomyces sp. NPDC006638]|uniref:hypothetical protein n=1 Tax=Streptomyces sp. NPDC006638 TaxID=3157183 RepID=UPI0033AF96A7